MRVKPFPIKLPFAAAARGSNPGGGGCGSRWLGGLGEEPRSSARPARVAGSVAGSAACQAASEEGMGACLAGGGSSV